MLKWLLNSNFSQKHRLNGIINMNDYRRKGTIGMAQIHDIIRSLETGEISASAASQKLKEMLSKDSSRRSFGLVYESHSPEVAEVPDHFIVEGDWVVQRSPRGEFSPNGSHRLKVCNIYDNEEGIEVADVEDHSGDEVTIIEALPLDSVIKTVSQDEVIFPGLEFDGEVIGDKDSDVFHSVICSENYSALRMLGATDLIGKVDCIYIDPPYNTGNKDWIYNNDYVDGSDEFRSSAFMNFLERRLQEAKTLLNPEDSVLILTIDEKEYLNVGMLLRQVFSGARIQMISSVINPAGVARKSAMSRNDEYIYLVMIGNSSPSKTALKTTPSASIGGEESRKRSNPNIWNSLRRRGREYTRQGSPGCFYPIYIKGTEIVDVGDPLKENENPGDEKEIEGTEVIYPIQPDGSQGAYNLGVEKLIERLNKEYVRVEESGKGKIIQYLRDAEIERVERGELVRKNTKEIDYEWVNVDLMVKSGKTQWNIGSHNAEKHGTSIINALHGEKRFNFPKSLYAVEDVIRFFVADKPHATILDFFGGSGTTAHAVMHLNEQDGGKRKSITVTNNEIGVQRSKQLSKKGYQSGDPEWEKYGVYEYATKPRITAAITGKTAASGYTEDVKGYYKYNDFQDEYAIGGSIPKNKARQFKDGLKQNVKFFKLNYVAYDDIFLNLEDDVLYPLIWLEQGQRGEVPHGIDSSFISDKYAIVKKLSQFNAVMDNCGDDVSTVYVHADENTAIELQESVGHSVEVVPLWDLYVQRMKLKTVK